MIRVSLGDLASLLIAAVACGYFVGALVMQHAERRRQRTPFDD